MFLVCLELFEDKTSVLCPLVFALGVIYMNLSVFPARSSLESSKSESEEHWQLLMPFPLVRAEIKNIVTWGYTSKGHYLASDVFCLVSNKNKCYLNSSFSLLFISLEPCLALGGTRD